MKKTLPLMLLLAGLTVEAQGRTLTWNGSAGHMKWDLEDTNWLQDGTPAKYADGDSVEFGDTGSGTVELYGSSGRRPASVLVDSDKDYTFSGATQEFSPYGKPNGYFSDPLQLTKSGSGTLTLQSRNICTGSLVLNEGTLVMGCDEALGGYGDYPVITINGGTLNLGGKSCGNQIYLQGSATIGNGRLNVSLTVEENLSLTLLKGTTFFGGIILKNEATLDMGGNSFHIGGDGISSNKIVLNGSISGIGNGTLNGDLTVAEGRRLTLLKDTTINGGVTLEEGSTFDMGGNTFHIGGESDSNKIVLNGSISGIGNGTIVGDLEVAEGHRLTLLENTAITGTIILKDKSTLDLGKNTIANYMDLTGMNTVVNGTLVMKGGVLNGISTTLILGGNATMDLNGGRGFLNLAVAGTGNTMKNGGFTGTLVMEEDSYLYSYSAMCSWEGPKSLVMKDGSRLEMAIGYDEEKQAWKDCWINDIGAIKVEGVATIKDAFIRIKPGTEYTLGNGVENLVGEGITSIALDNSIFNLDSKTTNLNIKVWAAQKLYNLIKDGTINTHVEIDHTGKLTLENVAFGSNAALTMGNATELDLGGAEARLAGFTFTGAAATVANGTLFVGNGDAATLNPNLNGTYSLELRGGALDLGNNTITKEISVTGNAAIGGGTIGGSVTLAGHMSAHFSCETRITGDGAVTVDGDTTAIKALKEATPGLMRDLTVSKGLIAGTGRAASLADGLDISRMGSDLTLENLVLTANNKISVGNGHTITLNNVTIKISDDVCQLVNGIYTIDLRNLINCDLEMENVLLDASDLTLTQGFDPATTSVVFDFGDDVSIKQATGLDMRLGNYWSPSVSTDDQGKVVFTKLVPTPEPTTGFLSLLGLGLLAGRRRRHN